MSNEDVGSVVIVEDEKPVDVITDRQIALLLEEHPDLTDFAVTDVIDGDVTTGSSDMTVFEALEKMRDASIRRLPIVEDDELIGIVTLDDVLVLLSKELEKATDIIRSQAPRL